jgi:hypothetical protein
VTGVIAPTSRSLMAWSRDVAGTVRQACDAKALSGNYRFVSYRFGRIV